MESAIGFVLTAIQFYIIAYLASQGENQTLLVLEALLFVFTEICAIIAESIMVRKKIKGRNVSTNIIIHRFRFSLVRRLIGKWLTMISTIFVLINGIILSPIVEDLNDGTLLGGMSIPIFSLVVLMIYAIWTIFFYTWYRTKIVISSIILIFSISCTIVMLFHRNSTETF